MAYDRNKSLHEELSSRKKNALIRIGLVTASMAMALMAFSPNRVEILGHSLHIIASLMTNLYGMPVSIEVDFSTVP